MQFATTPFPIGAPYASGHVCVLPSLVKERICQFVKARFNYTRLDCYLALGLIITVQVISYCFKRYDHSYSYCT